MPRLVGLPRPVRAVAPAKVNLALAVGPLRDDGYHELTTVFHAVDLLETVTLTPAPALSCTVSGEDAAEVPTGEDNLAVRAVLMLAEEAGVEPAVAVDIQKQVPVAAGLAGGSADAAAALVAAASLWRLDLNRDDLAALGARLGSDVPFALHGGTALGTGRGERLSPVLARGRFAWVLALADGGLSTPEVYGALDQLRARAVPRPATLPDTALGALVSGDPARLGAALVNDLQAAAVSLRPALRRTLSAGLDQGAVGAVVSGSGPTVAFLARDPEAAGRLSAALSASGTCRAVRRATGPAAGAHVVGQDGA